MLDAISVNISIHVPKLESNAEVYKYAGRSWLYYYSRLFWSGFHKYVSIGAGQDQAQTFNKP